MHDYSLIRKQLKKKKIRKKQIITALIKDLQGFDELFCEDSYNIEYKLEKEDIKMIVEGLTLLKDTEGK